MDKNDKLNLTAIEMPPEDFDPGGGRAAFGVSASTAAPSAIYSPNYQQIKERGMANENENEELEVTGGMTGDVASEEDIGTTNQNVEVQLADESGGIPIANVDPELVEIPPGSDENNGGIPIANVDPEPIEIPPGGDENNGGIPIANVVPENSQTNYVQNTSDYRNDDPIFNGNHGVINPPACPDQCDISNFTFDPENFKEQLQEMIGYAEEIRGYVQQAKEHIQSVLQDVNDKRAEMEASIQSIKEAESSRTSTYS